MTFRYYLKLRIHQILYTLAVLYFTLCFMEVFTATAHSLGVYPTQLNHTNVIFVGRILPNIQAREHSGAMLKCNGSGKIFTLSWSVRQDSIVKRSLGNGWARAFSRVLSALDFRIYVFQRNHTKCAHWSFNPKIKTVECERIYMESKLAQVMNIV